VQLTMHSSTIFVGSSDRNQKVGYSCPCFHSFGATACTRPSLRNALLAAHLLNRLILSMDYFPLSNFSYCRTSTKTSYSPHGLARHSAGANRNIHIELTVTWRKRDARAITFAKARIENLFSIIGRDLQIKLGASVWLWSQTLNSSRDEMCCTMQDASNSKVAQRVGSMASVVEDEPLLA